MIPNKSKEIMAEFRAMRNQSTEVAKIEPQKPTRIRKEVTPYDSFYKKYSALEEYIDSFGTRDLVYYFREVASENGYKYVISNIKKDMAIMKRLRENYSNREICGMIEFLYESEQDYLDKSHVSINLLASQWINTIYADMQLWVNDEYETKSKKNQRNSAKAKREWNKTSDDNVKIGAKF